MDIFGMAMAKKMGGGASSWNDLPDKPFGTEVTEVEIISETAISEIDSTYSGGGGTYNSLPEIGKTYTVHLDSGSYESVCKAGAGDLQCFLGNSSMIDGVDTGETFVVFFYEGTEFEVADFSCGKSIRVTGKVETIKPLDAKYLPPLVSPNGTKYAVTVSDGGALSAAAVSE